MRFLSYDSKFGRFFLKISYACCLNVLWFVCCLPIFTIGASTTALYYTCFKIAKDEGSFISKMFFRSFKQNFKQATVIWLIMLAVGLLLGADALLLYRLHTTTTGPAAVLWTLMLALSFAFMILYVIVLFHIFPLLSIASNTTANMFKNAFLIGTHYLFVTILVLFVHYAMFFLVVNVFTPVIVLGEGPCALIIAHILLKILRPMLQDPNQAQPEENAEEEAAGNDAPEYMSLDFTAPVYGKSAGGSDPAGEKKAEEAAGGEAPESGSADFTAPADPVPERRSDPAGEANDP